MLDKGRYQDAIRLLEPLAARWPGTAHFHALLGSAYVQAGELWSGAEQYEKALSLGHNASLLVSLGFLYIGLELRVLASQAFRQALKSGFRGPLVAELRESIQMLEGEISDTALLLDLPLDKVTKGLRFLEEGQIALHDQTYARSVHLNRKATRLLGDFPPPHNNLSLALFFQGMPQEAIQTARQVVARYPDNIQALSNLVRFLAWTMKTEQARQVWEQLKLLTLDDYSTRMKMAEAAAIMDADEDVYRLLREMDEDKERDQSLARRGQLYLAVAEANTGRRAAKRRLKMLQETVPWAGQILKALQEGKRGLGWAERFPYFHASELLPRREMETFLELLVRRDKIPAAEFRHKVKRYATRFPQLVLVGKKTLLEDQQTDAAVALLTTLGTPEAYAVLREFGLGQAGDDETRLQALFALSEVGQIPENELARIWQDGEWREVQLRRYEIIEGRELEYVTPVVDLLNKAILVLKENQLVEAEELHQRVLALEPRAKEAYNNLGTVYARQEKHAQAREMYLAAIELDPLYVMPRCNLAMYLLGDEEVEEAEEMIAPLVDVPRFHPHELALLSYIQARIHIEYDEHDQARNRLETALEVYPDYELVQDLFDRLTTIEEENKRWLQFWEKQHRREQARRERQRSQINTPDPTLSEALGIYTKEILTAIARRIIPWGGWSSFKKAELHQYLVDYLLDGDSLARVLESLSPEERKAFEHVRANGGTLAWDLFDQDFDNDLDESPYWQYHEPESVMGRLRAHGLLVEVRVEGKLLVSIPVELR
jgi:Flp pilus assembly protein TadD